MCSCLWPKKLWQHHTMSSQHQTRNPKSSPSNQIPAYLDNNITIYHVLIDQYQLNSGLAKPILEVTTPISWSQVYWVNILQDYLAQIHGKIILDQPWTLKTQRENDQFFMMSLLQANLLLSNLEQCLNICCWVFVITWEITFDQSASMQQCPYQTDHNIITATKTPSHGQDMLPQAQQILWCWPTSRYTSHHSQSNSQIYSEPTTMSS